jgi:hypothetical protein
MKNKIEYVHVKQEERKTTSDEKKGAILKTGFAKTNVIEN